MKKTLVFLLALCFCLCCALPALAADEPLLISPAPASGFVSAMKTDYAENYYSNFEPGQLPMAAIRSVAVDKAGNLWIGTYGSGAAMRPAGSDQFMYYSLIDEQYKLQNDLVLSMAADDKGGVWMAQMFSTQPDSSAGAAYYYDGKITYYNTENSPIANNCILVIKIDANQVVWFGTNNGISSYDPASGEWHSYTVENAGMPTHGISALGFDSNGNVWYGCYPEGAGTAEEHFHGGVGYISPDGRNHVYPLVAGHDEVYDAGLLADIWAKDIAEDADGNIWMISSGSYADRPNKGGTFYIFDKASNFENYTVITGQELLGDILDVSINSEVRCIEFDKAGTLWVGTWNGVYAFDKERKDRRCFSAATGDWKVPEGSVLNKQLNNVYALDIIGDKMYISSLGGLVIRDFDYTAAPGYQAAPSAPPAAGKALQLTLGSARALIDGAEVTMDVAPEVVDVNGGGVTFVPVRFVTENLGLVNNWSADAPSLVKLVGAGVEIELNIGSAEVKVNGESRQLLAAPFVKNNRTLVPLRFISETLGHSVNYDSASQSITIR